MEKLHFKAWVINELANYGSASTKNGKPRGGTAVMWGDEVFKKINVNTIIDELARLPIGNTEPRQKWAEVVEYGYGPGALRVSMSPNGSLKAVTRRLTTDLQGENVWVCKHIFPLCDNKDQRRETEIAHLIHNYLNELSDKDLDAPVKDFDDIEGLARKLWEGAKKYHPGYIMFPYNLKKMNDDYYKLVFEIRGQGIGTPNSSRTEQFDIDLYYDRQKGLIRCWGYDIASPAKQRLWQVQTPEWDEWFSPRQDYEEIIENILSSFLQY